MLNFGPILKHLIAEKATAGIYGLWIHYNISFPEDPQYLPNVLCVDYEDFEAAMTKFGANGSGRKQQNIIFGVAAIHWLDIPSVDENIYSGAKVTVWLFHI